MASEKTEMAEQSTAIDQETAMIESAGLSKFYGKFVACQDVSFKIHKGEVVAFLGPNGAGKSTTMKMLTGYISPSEGTARIAGHDMTTHRIEGSEKLGYLPENGPLYPDMTPNSLLRFFGETRGMSKSVIEERVEAVVNLCNLQSVLHKPVAKLSRGFRQRCGMAQALLHEPEVLIMDEPTSGLDPNQIQEVRETMQRLGKDRTILLSTHILQEVTAVASRVIMINEGQLVYDGPIDAISESDESLDDAFRRLTALNTAS
jgi:ABC-2 type transport system ATP-binding protein